MSSTRSRMAIFGPILGFILLYAIVRYGVTDFRGDLKHLSEYGAATIQEVQESNGVALDDAQIVDTEADGTEEASQ